MLFLADVHSNIGTGNNIDQSNNGSDFHLFEFHLPTAGIGFSIVLGLGLLIFVAWFLYRRRAKKHKARMEYQKMLVRPPAANTPPSWQLIPT